mgnify:CR=1 FL=1
MSFRKHFRSLPRVSQRSDKKARYYPFLTVLFTRSYPPLLIAAAATRCYRNEPTPLKRSISTAIVAFITQRHMVDAAPNPSPRSPAPSSAIHPHGALRLNDAGSRRRSVVPKGLAFQAPGHGYGLPLADKGLFPAARPCHFSVAVDSGRRLRHAPLHRWDGGPALRAEVAGEEIRLQGDRLLEPLPVVDVEMPHREVD